MAEKEKYCIALDGQVFEVSRELYEAYYKGERKEKYFMHDLKESHTRIDQATGKPVLIPGREESYEKLLETGGQFASDEEPVEDTFMRTAMLEKLNQALRTLDQDEMELIYALFFMDISEVELAGKLGVPRTTLRYRKDRILKKLKKML